MPPDRVSLRTLVPYLRSHRGALGLAAGLALLGALAGLAQPLLTRLVLAAVEDSRPLTGPVLALIVVVLLGAGIGALLQFVLQRTGEGVVLDARVNLAGHLLRLPIAEYDRRRTGDLLSRVGADTTLLRAVVTSGLIDSVSGVLVFAGALVAMLLLDPLLLAVTLAAVLIGVALAVSVARRVRPASERAQARVGDMTAAVDRALGAVRTIRAAGAEDRETAAVAHAAHGAYDAGLRAARLQALVAPAVTVAVQGSFVLVLAIGGARVAAGDLRVSDLVAFVLYLFLLVLPLAQALQAYTVLQTGLGALQRIEDVLAIPAETSLDAPAAAGRSALPGPLLRFSDVSFSYDAGLPVLSHVTFTVPVGSRVALVGPSGAGKSTVLALVERFYAPTAGQVDFAGRDLTSWDRAELRAQIGYVEQEAPVLAGSLRDNLLLGKPGAGDQELLDALAAVNLTGLTTRSPDGLSAAVGDGGVLLSGGERQRIAIARALLARPRLLLLDEPTANLDARNEVALRQAVDAVAQDRTLLVVAHRLSTVVDSDVIVVLDRGRVEATGTHLELLETSELYRELATAQLLVAPAA